jgi:hypothetical protein
MKSFLNQIIIAIDGEFKSKPISNKSIQCFIYLCFLFQVQFQISVFNVSFIYGFCFKLKANLAKM